MQDHSELKKLDFMLGVPEGTSEAVLIRHDATQRPMYREALLRHGVVMLENGTFDKDSRKLWREVKKAAGLSRSHWSHGFADGSEDNVVIETLGESTETKIE